MSEVAGSAACLTQAIENDDFQRESFHKFFECWLVEQSQHLQELTAACEESQARTAASSTPRRQAAGDDSVLRSTIKTVIDHYEQYYRGKSAWAKHDAVGTLSPAWRSALEDAFAWIGGWRPSVAIHLLYSKSGLQLEGKLTELLQGLTTLDLGGISPDQLAQVDELHRSIVRQERKLTEILATLQETVADSSMVELSHDASVMGRGGGESGEGSRARCEARIEEVLSSKEDSLEVMLQRADELRLETLKTVVDILTPIQAIHFLIAAAELHLRIHEWGKKREARHEQENKQNELSGQVLSG